jgi:hypothetical protein
MICFAGESHCASSWANQLGKSEHRSMWSWSIFSKRSPVSLARTGSSLAPPVGKRRLSLRTMGIGYFCRRRWPPLWAAGARSDRAHGGAVLHDDPRRYGCGGRQARTPRKGRFRAGLGRRQRAQPLFPLYQPQQEGHHPRLQAAPRGRRSSCSSSQAWMCWSRTIGRP